MTELRVYLRRESDDGVWILRNAAGTVEASGSTLGDLPKVRTCHLVLAQDLVTMIPARLPDWPLHKLTPLLPGAAEAHALGDAEALQVACMGRDAQGTSWLAVMDREWLHSVLARLSAQGIQATAALPEYLLLPSMANTWSVLRHEEGVLLRTSLIAGWALDQGDPPAGLWLALERETLRPEKLRLYQGSAVTPVDLPRWSEVCGLPVEQGGAWSWRDAVWPDSANLLQGVLQPNHDRLTWQPLLRPLLWGCLLVAGIHWAGMTLDTLLMSREQRALQTQMRQLAEQVLPQNAAIADPAWQVERVLRSVRIANGDDRDGMVTLLGLAGRALPADGEPALLAVNYESGRLSFEYGDVDKVWVDRYVASLRENGLTASIIQAGEKRVTLVVDAAGTERKYGQ